MKLLGISGTLVGTKTKTIVQNVLDHVNMVAPEIQTECMDLRDYRLEFCDGRDPQAYTEDTKKAIELINHADFYVIGTPVFQSSLSGALKNLLDLVPPASFRQKVVGLVATGGTYQHYLVIENQLKPIFGYFRSIVAPSYVYAHSSHFNQRNDLVDEEVCQRVAQLAEELIWMQQSLQRPSDIVG
ncbi:NADPH-dependent FMN reductase [Brevibacillus fulvus]|uniref:FMN reductase/FAD reductase [NAD(P)H] n=1 Tax=Brevibacillus fulvus TaxID=1125967 RepID=A0A939BR55_9BACL|nr:NADPH-dependent FMN reductase [Brevibacillus fulvus]MBM7589113.1 FMN reductase/FAD reductase [NAD(P)H] [Brevibacillus fulvus]